MSLELYNTTKRAIPERLLATIIRKVIESEGCVLEQVVAVFCGKKRIHRMNREFLGHDYPTDTITFRYSGGRNIDGECYLSLDVIDENARRFDTDFERELFRVIIHSALHLVGYDDGTEETRALMSEKEEYYLARFDL